MNSLTTDTLRIALLGLAFELSRYIAKGILGIVSSAFENKRIAAAAGQGDGDGARADKNSAKNPAKDDIAVQTPNKPPLPPLSLPRKVELIEEEYRPRSDSLLSQGTESSVVSQSINIQAEKGAQKQYLEILVHNVAHTDLILGLSSGVANEPDPLIGTLLEPILEPEPSTDSIHTTPKKENTDTGNISPDEEKFILCRPRFSAFDMFSRRIKNELSTHANRHPLQDRILSYPKYERTSSARYTLVTPRSNDEHMLPVGFNLERVDGSAAATCGDDSKSQDELFVDANDMPSLRVRGRDISRIDPTLLGDSPRRLTVMYNQVQSPGATNKSKVIDSLRINAVFFPLLSTLLPRWLGQIADKFGLDATTSKSKSTNVKKVIVLVSGVGSPRNWTHTINGNSTQVCADLMELFINELFPDVTVIKIHSQTNIFRYDENISFATQELMPVVDAYRDACARSEPYPDENQSEITPGSKSFNPDWTQFVSVAYSFADGSAARTHAIQAALRPYRPTYFHFWQLKTFWHDSKITTEDIEVHSFEEMEAVPAIAVSQTSGSVSKVINEVKAFREDFLETLEGGRSDLASFWLRKTKKPVLAVLLVQKPNGDQVLYRGTNMEVSMPTGSLCAERNVIGTALATDPSLKREDLLMVAVLSIQLPEPSLPPKLTPPSGAPYCRPIKAGVALVNEVNEKLKLQPQNDVVRSTSKSSIAEANTAEWEMDISNHGIASPPRIMQEVPVSPSVDVDISQSGSSTPKRHVSLYKFADPQSKSKKRLLRKTRNKEFLVLQTSEDINPLKPCGACNEWLKKIAESNPHFKVLTFTDALCNGVYVSPCQE